MSEKHDPTLGVEGVTDTRPGDFGSWDAAFPIYVANEATNNREWFGELHLIAVYEQALDENEVEQNFLAGP